MSDCSDIRKNPSAPPSYQSSYVAEHLCETLRFSCTDGRDDGMLATRLTPVTPVAAPAQTLECALTASPPRRLGSFTIMCAAPDRWHPVAHRAADRAAVTKIMAWIVGQLPASYGDRAQ